MQTALTRLPEDELRPLLDHSHPRRTTTSDPDGVNRRPEKSSAGLRTRKIIKIERHRQHELVGRSAPALTRTARQPPQCLSDASGSLSLPAAPLRR